MGERRHVDCLTVLHNKRAVDIYSSHHKIFKNCKSERLQLNFKVARPEKYKDFLPEEVEAFDYERIPYQGSIDHAYNLHALLNFVESEWFCILDPDVYPLSDNWEDNIDSLMREYEAIGIPYSSKRDNIYRDYPAPHLAFYKKDIFFDKARSHGLYDGKQNWYVFYPITKSHSLKHILESGLSLSRQKELNEEHQLPTGEKVKVLLDLYNKKYSVSREASADTAWKTSVMLDGVKAFCLLEHDREEGGFVYSDEDKKILFAHLVYATGGSNKGLKDE